MASDNYGQLTTIVARLGRLGSLLNPLTLLSTLAEVVRETSVPPPGRPDELEQLASAFRSAAHAIEPIGRQMRTLGTRRLPEVWGGDAGESAARVASVTAQVVAATPVAFDDTARVLEVLAGQIRDQQRRHAELRQRLYDAYHDATHIAALPIPDPFALNGLVRAVAGLIAGARGVYTEAMSSADTAAVAFADITSRARTAAAVDGGLDATGALLPAAEQVGGYGVGSNTAILTPAQLTRAGQRLNAMSPEDRARAEELLARAGSGTERAYLLKAVAAGHSGTELTQFADTIRDQQPHWLHSRLNLIDLGGMGAQERFGARVNQYDNYTCGTTSLIITRAQADPLYALRCTEGLEGPPYSPETKNEFDRRFAAEQAQVHDQTNVIYPQFLGTSPMGMAGWLNQHRDATGTSYDYQLVDDTNQRNVSGALREVVSAVEQGHPVPILVGGPYPAHYVTVVGHQDGNLLIFEPSEGVLTRVPTEDFVNGDLRRATYFDHVQAVLVPAR